MLWRTPDGTPHAARDQCPHRGAALSLGQVRDDTLMCPYHGWVTTAAVAASCSRRRRGVTPPPNARLDMFDVCERYGVVFAASVGTRTGRRSTSPSGTKPGVRHYHDVPVVVHACGPRIVENFLDMAHFPFVHAGVLGAESHTEVRDYTVTTKEDGIEVTNCVFWQPAATPGSDGGADVEYRYRVPHPYVATLTKLPRDGTRRLSLMIMASPLDEEQCRAWMIGAFTDPDVSTEDFIDVQPPDLPAGRADPRVATSAAAPARPERRARTAGRPRRRLPPIARRLARPDLGLRYAHGIQAAHRST